MWRVDLFMAYASDVSFLFMVAGSRCAVAGWLAAPRCAKTAWQLQGSSLIARGASRVVSITLYPPIPGSSCLYLQVIKL